jgi:cell division protein FtsQ
VSPVLPVGPRLQERQRAQRRAQRRALARRAGLVATVLAPLALVAWVLLASPWLAVRTVAVSGEGRLSAQQVLAAARVPLGTPLARVDTGAVAARVRALGPVASVSVSRRWPHTIRLSLVERAPVAAAGSGRTWTLYDGTGVRLGTVGAVPAGVVRLQVAHPGPQDPATGAALQVLDQLPAPLRRLVAAVGAASPEQVGLVLRDGRRVVWGGASDGRAKAAALTTLLRLPGRVYDVSSPSVVTRR